MRVNDSEERRKRDRTEVPSSGDRAETITRNFRDSYFEWLEKQPRKT